MRAIDWKSRSAVVLLGLLASTAAFAGAASADLSITKTDGVTTATPGGSVTYTIVASNAGPSAAPGAVVADTLPAILTATWTCVGTLGGTCTAAGSGNINDTVNLPVGGSVTYTVSATIDASATGTLGNTATVTGGNGFIDPVPGNNSATDTDTLAPQADLQVTIFDSPDPISAGSNITYSILVLNAGPSSAAALQMTFPLHANTTFISATSPPGSSCVTPAVGATGTVTCTFSVAVLPASGPIFTVVATVIPSATGSVSATATASSGTTDPTPGNDAATAVTTINGATFVVTTVAVSPVGGSISCVSPVASGSTTTCTAAANPGFTLTQISGCGGVPSATSPYTTGPINAPCTVTALFAANGVGGAVTAVPALQDGALAALALLLAALGWVGMRRR